MAPKQNSVLIAISNFLLVTYYSFKKKMIL